MMSSAVSESQSDKTSETTPSMQDSTTKLDLKEDVEERYNKLRGFAVKLKKKVSDLSEELKNSENERLKAVAEKEELQNKISQISDNAKKLQTIQSEYDKVQDNLEEQKRENKKTSKYLETVVLENATLKESIYGEKENVARSKAEIDRRTKETANLENALKMQQNLVKTLKEEKKAETMIREQREKDYVEMKAKFEAEVQLHKTTKAQLDAAKQERTTNSVLSLEVDNYERSVEDLKSKLEEESSKQTILEKTIEEQSDTISQLEAEVQELRDSCLTKANQITILSEKNEGLKADLCEIRHEMAQSTKETQSLVEGLEAAKRENVRLTNELEAFGTEKIKANEEIKIQIRNHGQQTKILETEVTRLKGIIESTKQELESLKNEYEGYKLRAQSVLRTKQNQNEKSSGKSKAELEEELGHARSDAAQLQEKLESCRESVKNLTTELNVTKEDRDRTLENSRELTQKLSALGQDYTALRDQYRMQTSTTEKERSEFMAKIVNLEKSKENQIAELEEKYRKEINILESEVQKLAANAGVADNQSSTNAHSEKHFEARSEHDSLSRSTEIPLQEREDGEGSESVESYPMGLMYPEKSRRHSLVPLDELLNSSDDYTKNSAPALPRKIDRQEFEVCERRVKHLTVLLADAERDVAKLTQLNQLLKEDIRRQQRSVEREHHANNFEYMKNVILKFVTLRNGDERSHLIPVLNTILKLSPEETQQLNQVAGVGRGWLPGIPIPGWHHG